jgi:hypothetical protein
MPPKKTKASPKTRTKFDGSIEQQCQKCQNWKPQLPHYSTVNGNTIVNTCQDCRNNMNAQYQAKKKNVIMGEIELEVAESVDLPSCTYLV